MSRQPKLLANRRAYVSACTTDTCGRVRQSPWRSAVAKTCGVVCAEALLLKGRGRVQVFKETVKAVARDHRYFDTCPLQQDIVLVDDQGKQFKRLRRE